MFGEKDSEERGRELPSSPTKGLFTGYRFPTLSYISSSQITILPYTWSLKKVPLSGGASPYRPLSGKYPPGLEATALTFKVQQSLSFRLSYGLQTEMISLLRYLFPGGIQDFKWRRRSVIEWGQTQNPRVPQGFQQNPKKVSGPKTNPKKSHAELPSKFVCTDSQTRFASMIPWLLSRIFRLFWIPEKIPTTNQAQKNTCQILLPPKNPGIETFKPTKSSDHPRHLKSEVHPPPPPPYLSLQGLNNRLS